MKKLLVIAALAIALAGCGSSSSDGGDDHPYPSEPVLDAIYRENPDASGMLSDQQWLDIVDSACGALADGYTLQDLTKVVNDNVPESDQIELARGIGTGISVQCPEYQP